MMRKPLGFSLFPTRDSAMPKNLTKPVEIDLLSAPLAPRGGAPGEHA